MAPRQTLFNIHTHAVIKSQKKKKIGAVSVSLMKSSVSGCNMAPLIIMIMIIIIKYLYSAYTFQC